MADPFEFETAAGAIGLKAKVVADPFEDALRRQTAARIINVLMSKAALKIDFQLDQVHLVGSVAFPAVAHAVAGYQQGAPGIRIRFGKVPAGEDARYLTMESFFDFPDWSYGMKRDERSGIVHE